MCGINGMVLLKKERSEEELNLIRYLYGEIMEYSQVRGKDATGVAVFNKNSAVRIKKAPIPAEEFITKKYWSKLVNHIDNDTTVVLGHVRKGTKGSPKNNLNNHPIVVQNIVGVHNGTIQNDNKLFKDFKFNRNGEVDSEIIFQLINYFNKESITFDGMKMALEDSEIRGAMALGVVHADFPNLVYILRQDRPMTITYWKSMGVIIFNSQASFVKRAFNSLSRLKKQVGIDLKVDYSIISEEVKVGTMFSIDANATNLKDAISSIHDINILAPIEYNKDKKDSWSIYDSVFSQSHSVKNSKMRVAKY